MTKQAVYKVWSLKTEEFIMIAGLDRIARALSLSQRARERAERETESGLGCTLMIEGDAVEVIKIGESPEHIRAVWIETWAIEGEEQGPVLCIGTKYSAEFIHISAQHAQALRARGVSDLGVVQV